MLLLKTKRGGLILRQHTNEADDLACLEAVQESPEHVDSYGNTVSDKYSTLEKATQTRREAEAKGEILMGIWDGPNFKGEIDAMPKNDGQEVEIAVWIRKSATGQGYATQALKALTEYLKPKFSRVFTEVHVHNQPSIKLMENSGQYVQTGLVDRDWGRAIVFEAKK